MNTKQTCPECGGEGDTWEDIWVNDTVGHSTKHYRCNPCDGTGEVLVEVEEDEPATGQFAREVVA